MSELASHDLVFPDELATLLDLTQSPNPSPLSIVSVLPAAGTLRQDSLERLAEAGFLDRPKQETDALSAPFRELSGFLLEPDIALTLRLWSGSQWMRSDYYFRAPLISSEGVAIVREEGLVGLQPVTGTKLSDAIEAFFLDGLQERSAFEFESLMDEALALTFGAVLDLAAREDGAAFRPEEVVDCLSDAWNEERPDSFVTVLAEVGDYGGAPTYVQTMEALDRLEQTGLLRMRNDLMTFRPPPGAPAAKEWYPRDGLVWQRLSNDASGIEARSLAVTALHSGALLVFERAPDECVFLRSVTVGEIVDLVTAELFRESDERVEALEEARQLAADAFESEAFATAEDQYTRAIELAGRKEATDFLGRARARVLQDRFLEALDDVNEGLALDPTQEDLVQCRASVYLVLEHYEDALADCETLRARGLHGEEVDYIEASALHQCEHYEKAGPLLRRVSDARPEDSDIRVLAANNALQLDRPKEALDWLDSAHEIEPQQAMILSMRALTYYDLEEAALAQEDIVTALGMDAHEPMAHFVDGLLAADGGDLEHAVTAFSSALRSDPEFTDALKRRAEVYLRLGFTLEAVEDYRAVIKLAEVAEDVETVAEGQDALAKLEG